MAPDEEPQGEATSEEPKRGLDRRTFVKGAMAGAAVGVIGAGGVATAGWLFGSEGALKKERETDYVGAKVLTGSPTRFGVPIVPLQVDEAGYLMGRAEDLRPYLYCARDQKWPGRSDDYAGDDYLRYHVNTYKAVRLSEQEARERWWYHDKVGERIHVSDFADRPNGTGAGFRWRDPDERFPAFEGVLIKLSPDEIEAEGRAAVVRDRSMDRTHGLIAFDAACTHFCCIAGWHEDPTAEKLGLWDTIFCTCHNARFDPRQLETYEFVMKEERSVL